MGGRGSGSGGGGGGGNGGKSREGKWYGVKFEKNGREMQQYIMHKGGNMYIKSDVAAIGKKVAAKKITVEQMAKNIEKSGGKNVEIISAKQYKKLADARSKERENKPDYEMGIGTQWGNKNNRRAARMSRLASRRKK